MNYSHNMYNNNNTSNNNTDWSFMNYSNNVNMNEPLQEPVAFEDFQFSLGLDPEFAMPIPLDIPPPPPPMTESDLFAVEPVPTPINNAVLDEQDHKAFSQFLDQFFVDPNMQIDTQFNMPPPMSLDNHHHPHHHQYHQHHHSQDEYHRQSTILQSLDEQKRYFNSNKQDCTMEQPLPPHERPGAVYLQQSNAITAPYIKPIIRESSSSLTNNVKEDSPTSTTNNGGNSSSGSSGGAIRRGKPHKELLTEEEKRSNHIASEQKRRSMIRTGFKDLTEIVPTLKNINNSKSTVLFKAVDYIKYLEKRNRNLREKIKNLEVRVEVEGRMGVLNGAGMNSRPQVYNGNYTSSRSRREDQLVPPKQEPHITTTTANSATATAALLQHKTQQRQLMELQEKLQIHQKMLAHQQQQQQQKNNNNGYRIYDQPRWNNDKSSQVVVETKMEVDTSSNESLKATVSA